MSTFSIPNNLGQIRQANRGDIAGELWATFNIDLTSSPGKIKVSRKLTQVLDTTALDGNDVVALMLHAGSYYALTTDELLECDVLEDPSDPDNWNTAVEGTGLDLGFESDLVSFGGDVLISAENDIHKYATPSLDADWWTGTISGGALTANKPHIMQVLRGGQETLFVTDSNKVRYYTAGAGHSTVTLDASLTACCLAAGTNSMWVGTYTEVGDRALVYEIGVGETLPDGTPVPRQPYAVEGRAILSIEVIDGVPYIVTEKGVIQAFNGAGFTTVGYFPFAYGYGELAGVRSGAVNDVSISRPVHPKGMKARNRSLLIALNSEGVQTEGNLPIDERTPSGVWEFNVDTGVLNHRQALTTASTQYGWHMQERSGPLLIVDNMFTTLLVAGEAGTNGIGLFVETTEENQGYIITTEIESQTVKDTFNKTHIKARTLGADERIVLKSRAEKQPLFPQYNDATWLNETQFVYTGQSVSVGDEVEIIEGYRAGYLAHVISVAAGASNVITIDESIGLLNEASRIRFQNWTKSRADYTDQDGEVKSIGIGEPKPWMQYKIQLKGDIELRQVLSDGKAKNEL